MDRIQKFLKCLDKKMQARVSRVAKQILTGEWKGLNIKSLQGEHGWYRCRIGNVRIVFFKAGSGYKLYEIGFRGNVYKK